MHLWVVISKKSTNKYTETSETCKNPYISLHEYNIIIYISTKYVLKYTN
jgi:hypothetical protein